MRLRPSTRWFVLVTALVMAVPLSAQTTGMVSGLVSTADGTALPSASITATGGAPGTRIAVSGDDGRYHLAALPPGTYEVEVSLQGFGRQYRSVVVSLGAVTTVDFTLAPVAEGSVTVVGEAPLVDTHAVALGNVVQAEAFTRIPLTRDYSSIALFQPGVVQDDAGFSVFGATGLENAFFIDGVDATGLRTGSQNKVVPEEFLDEVQVRTATYPAEFGGAFGGVVNVVTRSGGNEYHGEAFGYFDNQSLQAKAKPGVVGGNFAGFTDQDFGASLGGYLLQDRLWFFAVLDRTDLSRDVRLITGSGSPYDGLTFRSQDRGANLYSGKLTWSVSSSTNVVGSIIGDPSNDGQQLVQDGPPPSRRIHEKSGAPDLSLIGTSTGDWWVGQVGLFQHRERSDRTADFVPPFLTTDDAQVPTLDLANCNLPGCYSGAPWVFLPTSPALQRERFKRDQQRASFAGYLGKHEFKIGVDAAQLSGDVYQSIPGGYDRILNRLADGTVLFTQNWFGDSTGSYGIDHVVETVSGSPKTTTRALYAQDTWTPIARLTVNAGVRYEEYRLKDAVTGGTITNLTGNYAPRLGIAWDPNGQGRQKVTLGYGRFFQPIPLDHQAKAFRGTSLSVTSVAGFSFDCNEMAVDCQSYPNRVPEPVDPRLKAPLSEQLSASFETKLTDQLKLSVTGLHSRLLRAVEDRCDVQGNDAAFAFTGNGCVLMNPGMGSFGLGSFPAFTMPGGSAEEILCTNGLNPQEGRTTVPCPALPKAKRTYDAIGITIEQRYSADTYLLASYVYSRLRGNYDGSYNELGEANPNTNFDFDYPGLLANATGRLANDRPHQLKVTGFHRFSSGITVGANAYLFSGAPKDKLGSFALIGGAPVPLYLAPRGSQGRTPAVWDLDLHVGYTLPVPAVRVEVLADIFRIFDHQTVLRTNPFYNFDGFQSDNSIQTNPDYGKPIEREDPRLVRVGLRLWF